jgi:hypothetical protein
MARLLCAELSKRAVRVILRLLLHSRRRRWGIEAVWSSISLAEVVRVRGRVSRVGRALLLLQGLLLLLDDGGTLVLLRGVNVGREAVRGVRVGGVVALLHLLRQVLQMLG